MWTAHLNAKGYPVFSISGHPVLAHRYAFVAVHGDPGGQLDHRCKTRSCVNPAHLEPVTCAENIGRRRVETRSLAPRKLPETSLDEFRKLVADKYKAKRAALRGDKETR